jgi:hypothetical protein
MLESASGAKPKYLRIWKRDFDILPSSTVTLEWGLSSQMQDMEKQRQEWEQELKYLQQNITPKQELRNAPFRTLRDHLIRFV